MRQFNFFVGMGGKALGRVISEKGKSGACHHCGQVGHNAAMRSLGVV